MDRNSQSVAPCRRMRTGWCVYTQPYAAGEFTAVTGAAGSNAKERGSMIYAVGLCVKKEEVFCLTLHGRPLRAF